MKVVPLPIEYENALVKKAQLGDDAAYRILREQYDSLLTSLVTKNIPTYDPADVLQELELTFYDTIMQFDFSRNVKFITHLTNMLKYRISALIKEMQRDKRKIAYERMEQISENPYYHDEVRCPGEGLGFQIEHPGARIDFEDIDLLESLSVLNETEIAVAEYIIQGYKNAEIAKYLDVRPWRVGVIRQNIVKKLRRPDGKHKLSFG